LTEQVPDFIVLPDRVGSGGYQGVSALALSELPEGMAMVLLKKFWLLWTSLIAVVLGFVTLATGMLTVGPILLVLGYCVLLPFFLWRSFQDSVGE